MNISTRAHHILKTNLKAIKDVHQKYMFQPDREVENNSESRNKGISIWLEALYSLLVQETRKKLADTMNALNIQEKCIILVYDECGELEQHSREDDLRRPVLRMGITSLLRAFKAADDFEDADGLKIFALFLDTSSSVFNKLASRVQGKTAPSARPRRVLVPLPPWTFFSFDANAIKAYDMLVRLDHVRLYGRAVSFRNKILFVSQIMIFLAALEHLASG